VNLIPKYVCMVELDGARVRFSFRRLFGRLSGTAAKLPLGKSRAAKTIRCLCSDHLPSVGALRQKAFCPLAIEKNRAPGALSVELELRSVGGQQGNRGPNWISEAPFETAFFVSRTSRSDTKDSTLIGKDPRTVSCLQRCGRQGRDFR